MLMIKTEFIKELSIILEKKITEKSNLDKADLDSIKVLELISFKEKKFKNLKIKPDAYLKCKSVLDIIKLFKIS